MKILDKKKRLLNLKTNSKGAYKFKLNYFAWIANFGVVPLFLFAAFLFAPAFFLLIALLLFVTLVLETIRQLLKYKLYCISQFFDFESIFLPFRSFIVKEMFILPCIFLAVFELNAADFTGPDTILTIGETKFLKINDLKNFSVENKNSIQYHFVEKNKSFLLKGIKLGHSILTIVGNDHNNSIFHIYVIDKRIEEKFTRVNLELGHLGFTTKSNFPNIEITGEIKNIQVYNRYQTIKEENNFITDFVTIDETFKLELIGLIYEIFYKAHFDSISCHPRFSRLECYYSDYENISDDFLINIKKKYHVSFFKINSQNLNTNLKIKIKLIQIERLDGEELNLGLDQISSNLSDFIHRPLNSILENNQVLLNKSNVKINTLAEPEINIILNKESNIEYGSEIPFTTNSKNNKKIEFKFSGLKIQLIANSILDKIKIHYQTELTEPRGDNENPVISGSKSKSAIILTKNSSEKLFTLNFKTTAEGSSMMPYLNRIPILGELFKSKSNQSTYKSISAIIEVSE